ncbi:MAG: ATP-binding cassette domain-containing protein, partial [Rhodovibrionaceae bacterium]
DMDDRIALLGANGNGKSTLVRMLAGRLKPLEGKQIRSPKLKIGYFAQDQAEELDLDATPLAHMERLMPMQTETRLRAQLGRFGLQKNKAETKVGSLSGGEKARLLFALMSREAPQILLLDEPTNHLDVDAREALIQALSEYDGAVVLVTHDPHLIELVADRLWLVKDGAVTPYDGDMQDYRQLLLEQRRQERSEARQDKDRDKKAGGDAKARRREAAAAREAVAHLRRSVRDAEKRIEALQAKVAVLEGKLADPEIYEGPTSKLMALQLEHKNLKDEIASTEEAWLAAQEELEGA